MVVPLLAAAVTLLGLASCCFGRMPIAPMDLVAALFEREGIEGPLSQVAIVLWHIRIPRMLAAAAVGAALASAGTAFQVLFRNPLVSPDVLGVSAGAGVGAAIGLLWNWPTPFVQLAAFAGGLAAVFVV